MKSSSVIFFIFAAALTQQVYGGTWDRMVDSLSETSKEGDLLTGLLGKFLDHGQELAASIPEELSFAGESTAEALERAGCAPEARALVRSSSWEACVNLTTSIALLQAYGYDTYNYSKEVKRVATKFYYLVKSCNIVSVVDEALCFVEKALEIKPETSKLLDDLHLLLLEAKKLQKELIEYFKQCFTRYSDQYDLEAIVREYCPQGTKVEDLFLNRNAPRLLQ